MQGTFKPATGTGYVKEKDGDYAHAMAQNHDGFWDPTQGRPTQAPEIDVGGGKMISVRGVGTHRGRPFC